MKSDAYPIFAIAVIAAGTVLVLMTLAPPEALSTQTYHRLAIIIAAVPLFSIPIIITARRRREKKKLDG